MMIILLGAPGAGKGTQAERIAQTYDLMHLSTGDLLRAAVKEGTELGKLAKKYMDKGALLPDDIILGIIIDVLKQNPARGMLFDGFPRSAAQAEGLDKLLDGASPLTVVLDVPDGMVVERLSSRRVCRNCGKIYNVALGMMPAGGRCECGGELYQRDDDRAETIQHRLEVYHSQTEPIIDYYRGKGQLLIVDGSGSPDEVFVRIKAKLG